MKKMRYIMSDAGITCADKVSSFGLESLLWNVPNDKFMGHTFYTDTFGALLAHLFINRSALNTYKEANGIKPLCPTQADVDAYSEFIKELFLFFEY